MKIYKTKIIISLEAILGWRKKLIFLAGAYGGGWGGVKGKDF